MMKKMELNLNKGKHMSTKDELKHARETILLGKHVNTKIQYAREAVRNTLQIVLSILTEPCYSKGERIDQTVEFCEKTLKEIANAKESIQEQ